MLDGFFFPHGLHFLYSSSEESHSHLFTTCETSREVLCLTWRSL